VAARRSTSPLRALRVDRLEDRSLMTVRPLSPADAAFASLSADGTSSLPAHGSSISPDGQLVAFVSGADDLVPNDANGFPDVFLYSVATGEVRLLSVSATGFSGPYGSSNPKFSPDGRYVLYDRGSENLFTNPAQVLAYDLQTNANVLVSASTTGGIGNSGSSNGSWSGDSTKAVFESDANNLVPGDTNGQADIFVRDLVAGTTVRASVAQDGTQAQPGAAFFERLSFNAHLGDDGRFVVFASTANNLGPADANTFVDIYVKDLQTGAVDLVTVLSNGVTQAAENASLGQHPISDDGRYVVFTANFSAFGGQNVLLRDRVSGTTTVVSVNAAGTVNRGGVSGVLTPDGRHVAFVSGGGDLDATVTDANGTDDVFVRDLTTGTTRLVSVATTGTTSGNGRTGLGLHPNVFTFAEPVVSPDGRHVAFHSDATNLVAGDTNASRDAFVRDLQTNATTLIARDSAGAIGNRASYTPTVSADFRFAAFESDADNLAPGDRNYFFRDVYFRDLAAGTTRLVSKRSPLLPAERLYSGGSSAASATADGRYVAFFAAGPEIGRPVSDLLPGVTISATSLIVRDTLSGQLTVENIRPDGVTAAGRVFAGFLSADGRFSAFDNDQSLDPAVPNAANRMQAWVRDRSTGATRMVSVTPAGTASGQAIVAGSLAMSGDGRYVAFVSAAGDLVTGFTDGNGGSGDVYVRDTWTNTTRLVSHLPGNATAGGNGASFNLVFSADGGTLAFTSRSTDLVTGIADANGGDDLFVFDVATGAVDLVTVNPAGTGSGNAVAPSAAVQLSADGRYVFFSTAASDLTAAPDTGGHDVFRRDLVADTTELVTVDRAGSGGSHDTAFSATPDGRLVAFASGDNNLVPGDVNGRSDIFVRDMAAGTTTLVAAGNESSSTPVISPDGRYVSFLSTATNLTPDFVDLNGPFASDLFLRDTVLGATLLVSESNTGLTGASVGFHPSQSRFFSADGRTLYFTNQSSNLYPGDRNGVEDGFAFAIHGAGRITGTVFDDVDGDGNQTGAEAGIPFWTVYLDADGNGRFDAGETNVQSDLNGHYAFTNLAAGTYQVGFRPAGGFTATTGPRTVTLPTATAASAGNDFGATAAAADLDVETVTASADGIIGGSARVHWVVRNVGHDAAAGDWQDAVYLSADQVLDAADTLLAVVPHAGGLAAGASYGGTATVPVPTLPPGSYHVFVRADRRLQATTDTSRENNLRRSEDRVTVAIPALTLGTPAAGQFAGAGQERYYQVTVPQGTSVTVTLDAAAAGVTELYARFGGLPAPFTFDHAALAPNQADQVLTIPLTRPGTYYLLARARSGPAATDAFTLTAATAPFDLISVGPASGSNTGLVTVEVRGTGMTRTTIPTLTRGATAVTPATVDFRDPTLLYATFDLSGRPVGSYAVDLRDGPQTDSLPDGFTVTDAPVVADSLALDLIVPDAVRAGRRGRVLIEYTNTGAADIVAPLLRLTATNATLRLPGQPAFSGSDLTFFGHAPAGPAGTLRPGQRGSVEIEFESTGPIDTPIDFQSFLVEPDRAMDWAGIKPSLRPGHISPEAWDAVFANFLAEAGATVGDYQAMLGRLASYLSGIGIYTADTIRLLNLALDTADGTHVPGTLASVTDSTLPASGADLSFARHHQQPIHGRYEIGPFGRGWAHEWDGAATTLQGGDVVIRAGSARRFFFVLPGGGYRATPGDHGTLTRAAGLYTLTEPDGSVTRFRADGKWDFRADANDNRVTAGYDGGGRLNALTHSSGPSIALSYNPQGFISQLTDSAGRVVTYSYTGDHLTGYADRYGAHTYTYLSGQGIAREHALASINFSDDTHVTFTYDARGRLLTEERDGGANRLAYTYLPGGAYTVTDAAGGARTFYFTDRGRLARQSDSLGRVFEFVYDEARELTRVVQPGGEVREYVYDAAGHVIAATDVAGRRTEFTYDARGNPTSFTDALGRTTAYRYDAANNLLGIDYPDGTGESFARDATGDLASTTNRRGKVIAVETNAAGQVTKKTYGDGSSVAYTYDARGRLATTTDASGTTRLEYSDLDALTRIEYPNGRFLRFEYNVVGQRTKSEDQDGATVNYAYDDLGRLDRLTDGGGALIVDYTYDAAGRMAREDKGNGTATTYAYNPVGELLTITHLAPGGAVNSRYDYTYDETGRRSTMTLTDGDPTTPDGTTAYGYDPVGQLTSVVLPGGRTIVYQYDAVGNRVSVTDDGVVTSYTTNLANEYARAGDTVYTYDADGNLVSAAGPAGTTTYAYSDENRLVGVTGPGLTASYTYDALGHRDSATVNGQSTSYLIDPVGLWSTTAEYDGAGAVQARNTYGLGLVSRAAGGDTAYFDFDATGNTVGLTGAAGQYVNRYSYLPFGETTTHLAGVDNPFTFVGQFGVRAEAGGLFDMRFRSYDPGTGQFNSSDPLGIAAGDVNFRRYVGNAPTGAIDPLGLECKNNPCGYLAEGIFRWLCENWGWFKAPPPTPLDPVNNNNPKSNNLGDPENAGSGGGAGGGGCPCDCPPGDDPGGPGRPGRRGRTQAIGSGDPNDITGPAGVGDARYVSAGAPLPYRIRFENIATATAPAQEVFVTHTLDADVELASFQLGDFGFGSLEVDVPDGLQSYATRLSYTNLMNGDTPLFVDVSAGLNAETRTVTWVLRAVDPATGELPDGVLDGFLPPNDETHRGEGFLAYTVRPLAGRTTGTTIDAQASIVFDTNAAILTNTFVNTIDGDAPIAAVNPLPPVSTKTTFPVYWDAYDPAGPGLDSLAVFVSTDGGPYEVWQDAPAAWTANYTGAFGHRYDFVAVARDLAGNVQPFPTVPQASVRVANVPSAIDDAFTVAAGRATSGNVLTNDSNPAPKRKLTAVLVDPPTRQSSFTLTPGGKFTYTPGPGWAGRDSFSYKIVDSRGGESNVARVELATHLVGFRSAKVSAAEKKGTVTLTIDLTAKAAADVTLSYVVAPMTARPRGADFILAAGTVTIAAGQRTATLTIPVIVDGLDENSESFQVWLTEVTGPAAIGKHRTVTMTVADADPTPKVAFAAKATAGPEGGSPVLEVTLDRPSGREVRVRYAVNRPQSSALLGADFELAGGTLTFPPGVTSRTIPLAVLDDTLDESDERVVVTLSRPTNAGLGASAKHTYTIDDDDAAPTVGFTAGELTAAESAGVVELTVRLSGPSGLPVAVAYGLDPAGLATPGKDFKFTPGVLRFAPGETEKKVVVRLVNDPTPEPAETVFVRLSAPTNAALSSTDLMSLTIADDD
jgi:RHS repeat-associated protein